MRTEPRHGPRNLPALTGVRFIAALAVIAYHYVLWSAPSSGLVFWASYGYLGVSLFYVLSGFVLAYTYGSFKEGWAKFYTARFARVYPALFISLVAGLAFALLAGSPKGQSFASFVTSAALIQIYFPVEHLQQIVNGPAWSVSCEAFFYALFPALLIALRRPNYLLAVAFLAWLAEIILLREFGAIVPIVHRWFPFATDYQLTYFLGQRNPLVRFEEFAIGVCLGLRFLSKARRSINPEVLSWGSVLLMLSIVATNYLGHHITGESLLIAFIPIFAALIYGLASSQSGILTSRPLVFLGECSYSLYLIHILPMHVLQQFGRFRPRGATIALFISIGISVACYRWIESPARSAIRRTFERRKRPDPALQFATE